MDSRMFRVNDIFYSLQGEGHNTGRAAVFVRFAGCNLRCPFCDTQFDSFHSMSAADIVSAIAPYPARFLVLTGGEPTLQVDEALVDVFHQQGYEVAMESNGTRRAPQNLDWLTLSPKFLAGQWRIDTTGQKADELKVVFDGVSDPQQLIDSYPFLPPLRYLQPCDTDEPQRNLLILNDCIKYIEDHPQWRLSLQTHKLIGIK